MPNYTSLYDLLGTYTVAVELFGAHPDRVHALACSEEADGIAAYHEHHSQGREGDAWRRTAESWRDRRIHELRS